MRDEFGNLRSVSLPDGREIEYLVDGRNRRVGKKIDGLITQGLLYLNQLEPIAELDGSGQILSQFVYSERSNVPSLMRRAGQTYRIVSDYLGSVRLVVNTNSGVVAQRLDYDEFGNVALDTNPGFQPFGYVGGIYDPDTKLTKFGARDYDAHLGRWLTRDLRLFTGESRNPYAYVSNDSVNKIDLWGNAELSYVACNGSQVLGASNYDSPAFDVVFHGYRAWEEAHISDDFGTREMLDGPNGDGCLLTQVSVEQIAEDIKNDPRYTEDIPINLVGCGSAGLAGRLSNILPNTVTGYSHFVQLETVYVEGRSSQTHLNIGSSQVWTYQ